MSSEEYHVRGPVPRDSRAYVSRTFEETCFDELSRGNWVVLVGPRQHGKTSALLRLAGRLEEGGLRPVSVSLQAAPPAPTYEQLLAWFARRVADGFGVSLVAPPEEDQRQLDAWLRAALPAEKGPYVLLVDEASGILDGEMRGSLYRQLRSLHDERDAPSAPSLGRGLTVLFSGTFEPALLAVDNVTSPFNVCQRVDTEDLTLEQARELAESVGGAASDLVDRAFELVGGQPFLLQWLFDAATTDDGSTTQKERFDAAAAELRSGRSDHVKALLGTVVTDHGLRGLASEIIVEGDAAFAATDTHSLLVTVGFAKIQGGRLVVRNRLYGEVGAVHPLLSADIPAETAEVEQHPTVPPTTATAAPPLTPVAELALPGPGTFDCIVDEKLRRYAEEMAGGAFAALNAGHVRLALVGFGSALEAMLIDTLEQTDPADVQAAIASAQPDFSSRENPAQPTTWRLVNLVQVSGHLPVLSNANVAVTDTVRDSRNLIHADKERQHERSEAALAPESAIAQGALGVLLRELTLAAASGPGST